MDVYKVKKYNTSQGICNFKGLKMRVTGFTTPQNEATVSGTGICLVERAADIPGDDPGSMEKPQW